MLTTYRIYKYDCDSFSSECVYETISIEDAKQKEEELNKNNPNNVYSIHIKKNYDK